MLRRRRPLARAAMLGGAGYVAYRAGKGAQQQATDEAEPDAQPAGLDQQQAGAPPPPDPTPPPAAVDPADAAAKRIEALSRLKDLLDAGVLSQAEFEAQKQKLLQG